ncbi:MAG TPA: hypothetical protein VFN52_03860 [Acidiferrobacteraceae bacterium]|nr:hypothetical protein [Acidiferrobacteraceae bacterium]
MAAFSNIFQKACPACAASVGRDEDRCACGYSFASPDPVDEEQLYHEYLEVRAAQVRERLRKRTPEAPVGPEAEAELRAVQAELDRQRERMRRLRESTTAGPAGARTASSVKASPVVSERAMPAPAAAGHAGHHTGHKVRAAAQELEQELARLRRGWASPFGAALAARRSNSTNIGRSHSQQPEVAALKAAASWSQERPSGSLSTGLPQALGGMSASEEAQAASPAVAAQAPVAVEDRVYVAPVAPEAIRPDTAAAAAAHEPEGAHEAEPATETHMATALPAAPADGTVAAPVEPVGSVASEGAQAAAEPLVTVAYIGLGRGMSADRSAAAPRALGPAVPVDPILPAEDVRTRLAEEAERVARRQAQERRIECPHCTAQVPAHAARCSCGFELPAAASLLPSVHLEPGERLSLEALSVPPRSEG